MNIPFRVKKLTDTAKLPEKANQGDLWDLFADDFCFQNLKDVESNCTDSYYSEYHQDILFRDDHLNSIGNNSDFSEGKINSLQDQADTCELYPKGRILIKTGIALELPKLCLTGLLPEQEYKWVYNNNKELYCSQEIYQYAVADLRPRSGLALKHGITVLNAPATIDNSYRKEIGVILYNAGHEPYMIKKGDKIAQMLIRPLYPSKMEVVKEIEDTSRGGYGSTGK